MSNQVRAQRLRRAREKAEKAQQRFERENPKFLHERLDLLFDLLNEIKQSLKHIDTKAQTAIIRTANLQHDIESYRDETKRILRAVADTVWDPQQRHHDAAERLDHIFQNAKSD